MKQMKKRSYRIGAFWLDNKWLIAILSFLIIFISIVTILNAAGLKNAIDKRTRLYINDVSFETAQNIDSRLMHVSQDLEMLGESISRIEGLDKQIEYLAAKRESLGYTALAIVDLQGNAYATDGRLLDFEGLEAFQQSLQGSPGVSLLDQQKIVYTRPIMQNGAVNGVLAGIRNQKNMQNLIQTHSFDGNGLSCITDIYGKVVISPTDLKLFLMLDDIFVEEKDEKLVQDIAQMQIDMQNHEAGNLSFETVDGERILLSYQPLQFYNWVLITLIPFNIISQQSDHYIVTTFTIIAFTILIFAAVILFMVRIYRNNQRQIEHIAYTDPVTGEMNNLKFRQVCEELLQKAKAGTYTIVSLNIKDFKLINEHFGSKEGNETLRYVLHVMERHLHEKEAATRGYADNFYLCIAEDRPEAVQKRLDDIVEEINAFNENLETPYYLTFRQGAYLVDDPSLDITTMQDRANIARKNFSELSPNICMFYNAFIIEQMQKERELINLMDASLKNEDFKIYLQPKVRLADGKVGGAEALVRWIHPQKGMIYPSDFIPLFEKSNAICRLDLYIFEKVCAQLQTWIAQGRALFPISVNLSRQHFRMKGFLKAFETIAKQYHIPEGIIEMELTESILFESEEIEEVKDVIREMHQMGFTCSLDDFGFGYSSLGLLSDFDVDTIKLDRCFFMEGAQKRAQDVVEAIVGLTKKLSIDTVAEGVELMEQVEYLRRIGCDMVQGYIFSKPLPIDEFERWVEEREHSRSEVVNGLGADSQ